MVRKISRFCALSWPERQVFLTALLLLPVFGMALRLFGLQRLQAWLDGSPVIARPSPSREELVAIGKMVNLAASQAPGLITCLARSLLLGWLLRRRGVSCELRIGVKLIHGIFEAHAWVEHQGTPINDADDIGVRFAALNDAGGTA